jgi:hypothetical protein
MFNDMYNILLFFLEPVDCLKQSTGLFATFIIDKEILEKTKINTM